MNEILLSDQRKQRIIDYLVQTSGGIVQVIYFISSICQSEKSVIVARNLYCFAKMIRSKKFQEDMAVIVVLFRLLLKSSFASDPLISWVRKSGCR